MINGIVMTENDLMMEIIDPNHKGCGFSAHHISVKSVATQGISHIRVGVENIMRFHWWRFLCGLICHRWWTKSLISMYFNLKTH